MFLQGLPSHRENVDDLPKAQDGESNAFCWKGPCELSWGVGAEAVLVALALALAKLCVSVPDLKKLTTACGLLAGQFQTYCSQYSKHISAFYNPIPLSPGSPKLSNDNNSQFAVQFF